jgi:NADH:ubiquinone oxidoreductase subunit E
MDFCCCCCSSLFGDFVGLLRLQSQRKKNKAKASDTQQKEPYMKTKKNIIQTLKIANTINYYLEKGVINFLDQDYGVN